MNRMVMSFDEINPFIRYPRFFSVETNPLLTEVKAYDYRLMYIYDGKGAFTIDDIRYEAEKGHLFLWRPGIKYSIHTDSQNHLSIIAISFDFTCMKSNISYPIPPEKANIFDEERISEVIEFNDLNGFNKLIHLKNMQSIESRLMELINEYMTRKKHYVHKIRGSFLSILCDIARCLSTSNTDSYMMNNKIDLIIEYIHKNYHNPITNQEIGEYFNFHPIYINRLMVKHTGFSLHQYLINYRISLAIDFLQNTSKSITEIAYLVGFKDINHFSKCFKKMVGLSPKNYITTSRSSL